MWKWAGTGKWEPIAGIEARDYQDDEFDEVCKKYDKQFSKDQAGSLKRSGLFQHFGPRGQED